MNIACTIEYTTEYWHCCRGGCSRIHCSAWKLPEGFPTRTSSLPLFFLSFSLFIPSSPIKTPCTLLPAF